MTPSFSNLAPGRALPRLALGAVLVAGAASTARPAAAQATPAKSAPASGPACDINQSSGSLGLAFLSIQSAQNLPDTAAKLKSLRSAVQRVTGDANAAKANPTGTALTLAQALTLMAQDPRLAASATRADLGYTGGTGSQPVDLVKTIDSLATVVEQAKPNCAATAQQIRAQAAAPMVNAAVAAYNAQKIDSAGRLAERSLAVDRQDALAYYFVASAAQQRNDTAAASKYWPRVAELTATDTTTQSRNFRQAALENIAINSTSAAQGAPAADQPARAKTAADAIRAFLTAFPNSPDAPHMQAQLAQVVALTGDKSAVSSVYADQLANPSKYDDLALTNAGVIASQAGNKDDAAKLFAAALDKNAYQRDALNNLTATYYQQQKWAQMIPVGQRLLAVDPANPENYLFLAYAYQGLAKAAPQGPQKKTYTDSLIKYNQLSEEMPVKVSFTEFTRGESRAVIGMNVEARKVNATTTTSTAPARGGARAGARPAAAPAASAGPKSYTLAVEFLDRNGQVVDTQNVTVGPLGVGDTKAARVESAKSGVAAFRYKLVS